MSNVSAKVGPYALVECLESGSAVQLWRAEHEGRSAAIRLVVDPTDEFSVARWRSELEALQALGPKSSLPKILAVFEDEKAFAVEWIGEEGLEAKVERAVAGGEPLSVEEAVGLGLSILDALSSLGQVHGALLPRQVRFDSTGRAVLYGVGRHPEQVPPRYMAPEMTGEGEIGLQTDQWHTAVVIFELVLGRTIYPGDWSQAFRLAFDADNSEAIGVIQQHSPALAKALLPALRHEGAQGYGSHAEMAMALQSCLAELEHGLAESPAEPALKVEAPEPVEEAPPEPEERLVEEPPESDESFLPEPLEEEPQTEEAPLEVSGLPADEESLPLEDDWKGTESAPPLMTQLAEMDAQEELPVGPPQLERVQIALKPKVLPDSLQTEPSVEDETGPLGHGLSPWEIEAFRSCEGADPVERGSWWVARDGAQTELPEQESEGRPPEEEATVETPVALPEPMMRSLDDALRGLDETDQEDWPLLEPSNLVGSLVGGEELDSPQDEGDSDLLASDAEASEPLELTPEQIVRPSAPVLESVLEEQEAAAEVQFNERKSETLEPPVLDELPPLTAPAPARIQLPSAEELELPGREVLTALLEQEQQEESSEPEFDLPWDQPEVVIPAPPKALEVAPAPEGTPDILSPRRPVARNRMEGVEWNQAWRPQPLSERIARGGLLVLLGAGIAWVVLG